jgi:HTH-type transcriptional regulator / antitoxin HigA
MRTANKANPFPRGIPDTFSALCMVHMPRAIHDHVEFENAKAIVHALAGLDLNEEQADYLETISILVDEYDRAHHAQPEKASPLAVLRYLVEEHDLSGRELGRILGNESAGGFILRGERTITIEQAKVLGKYFSVGPALFLDLWPS